MLKRIAAILLLSVLLFNWVGYRVLTAWWEYHAAARLDAALDKEQYDPNQLILLRVPADVLPYSNTSEQFKRSTGYIEIGATRYRIVKRRHYNDSIEFLCIPDGAANHFKPAKENGFRLVNDLQKSGHFKFPGARLHLYYFSSRPTSFPVFQRTMLSPGHLRIGLQPPRPGNFLS